MKIELIHESDGNGIQWLKCKVDGRHANLWSLTSRSIDEAMKLAMEYIELLKLRSEPIRVVLSQNGNFSIVDELDIIGDKFIIVEKNDECIRCFSYDKFGTTREQAIDQANQFIEQVLNYKQFSNTIKTIEL